MRRSVLAFISTSLLAAAAWTGENTPDPAQVAALELEASLARLPAIYLVLDPAQRTLEIKARGVALDTVHLRGIELVTQERLLARHPPTLPQLPAVWKVSNGPGDWDREVIAPTELRPEPKLDDNGDDESDGAATPEAPAPTPTPARETSSSYRATLSSGWDLWITEALPSQTRLGLFIAAVRDGLARMQGKGRSLAPALTLAMSRSDAQRIHHLIHSGMALLVTAAP
jgi:hypothetical protein